MKAASPPKFGPQYWRSLDQLADTPEFRSWAEREFPAGASELSSDFTRRDFVKIMSASFLLAGLGGVGCRRPEEHIVPFSKKPEHFTHGVARYYATAMPTRSGAIPLLVKSQDGRPVKVEGNPDHPDSNGGTNLFAQAFILGLYDPDRTTRYVINKKDVGRERALEELKTLGEEIAATEGAGVAFLLERSTSPTRRRLLDALAQKAPNAGFFYYEPIDTDLPRRACQSLFGQSVQPHYELEKAEVILSLDCDFIGAEEDNHRLIRGFSRGRKNNLNGPVDQMQMSRLYAVEALMTLTGGNADHRLRVRSSQVAQVAAQIAIKVLEGAAIQGRDDLVKKLESFGEASDVEAGWILECAKDLVAHPRKVAVLSGYGQPLATQLIAQIINLALGAVNETVRYLPSPAVEEKGIKELHTQLNGGAIRTLVIMGGNPVYNAPGALDWSSAQSKAGQVIRWGYYEDETGALAKHHFPATHILESWGDARSSDGTLVAIQPLIAPLFNGISDIEFLARLSGEVEPNPHSLTRATFVRIASDSSENAWKKHLHDGFLANSASQAVEVTLDAAVAARRVEVAAPPKPDLDSLELLLFRDACVDDGRFANNGWLQELPDPITKMTWDNAVLLSRKTADHLKVKNQDMLEIEVDGRKIVAPVWVQPGLAEKTLAISLGYGRKRCGRVGGVGDKSVGVDAYPLLIDSTLTVSGVKAEPVPGSYKFSCTQDHWSMEGRPVIREANFEQYKKTPHFAKNMGLEAHMEHVETDAQGRPKGIYEHPYDKHSKLLKSDVHQWGMSIDLNACVGCSACVVACQSENNIPIVGKEQVGRGREMHWIRIDRYYSGGYEESDDIRDDTASDQSQQYAKWIDDPQMVTQPMLCQHCENAPCESVCPVNATVHDDEGLNVMAYNRCVGTRYCSNNCPYKVRRFNFFDYNKRPLDELYRSPLTSFNDGEWELKRWLKDVDRSTRPEDEWELLKLARNPDVSVRMRGIMEKCSYCLQRIEQTKITRKIKAGASDPGPVPDGTIQTACQQACPAEAIVFGNILDDESQVSQLKNQDRDYGVLGYLDTRPRTTYLAKVRNPNPNMPDHEDSPKSLQEYSKRMNGDDPIEPHHGNDEQEQEGEEH